MLKRVNPLLLVLAAVLLSRFVGMALFPFVDTTEPRYAEMARIMAETGDWITPWFEPGVPFWGKPPLAFWMQAMSIRVFGLSELSARLPAWLATLALIWLTWRLSREMWGQRIALWGAALFATMALTYISAGAVMTDTFLALGTTLSLVSFSLVIQGRSDGWRWLFFIGLVIGLLAKGPLTLVLTGIPITLWLLLSPGRISLLKRLPWGRGILLTLLLACPWYVLAELKTPGFLNYFLIGEHILRFIDPGWQGDLYGSAHQQPKGMIWVFWVWASFPWGILALAGLVKALAGRNRLTGILRQSSDGTMVYLLFCAIAPMLFFSLAGNTLWTYVLPSLPFSAMLIGRWITPAPGANKARKFSAGLGLGLVPTLLTAFVIASYFDARSLKTEKQLVGYYNQVLQPGDSPLYYVGELPHSARYYSRELAQEVTREDLINLVGGAEYPRYFIAVPKGQDTGWLEELPANIKNQTENRRYQLIMLDLSLLDRTPRLSDANIL